MPSRPIVAIALTLSCLRAGAAGLDALNAPPGQWRFGDGQTAIAREVPIAQSWAAAGQLSFRVRLSQRTLKPLHLFAYLVTGDHLWYQTSPPAEIANTRPTTIRLDLSAQSPQWVPTGHLRPWGEQATEQVHTFGLKAVSEGSFHGSIVVEGARLEERKPPSPPRLRILDFRAPARACVGQLCEMAFRLPPLRLKTPEGQFRAPDPFEPAEINVQGLFILPGGGDEYRLVPGFYYQGYAERWEGQRGRAVPLGPPQWRIRYWPERPGTHRCTLLVHTPQGEARMPWRLEVRPAPPGPAPRAAQRAPLALRERWPDLVVGRDYNGRDTVYIHRPGGWRPDGRQPPKGELHAWRAPIEWTARWGGYGGLGHYNLAVAARFDQLLDEAARRGLALPLALTCDEPFGERAKFNWKDNPLNTSNGGPLAAPSQFFTSPRAWPRFQRRVRYTLARWGGHPAVASWELWASMPTNGAEAWHARAGEYLATWKLGPKDIRSFHPQTVPPAALAMLNSFRTEEMQSRQRWLRHTVIKHSLEALEPSTERASEGKESLKLLATYPGEAAILRQVEADWHTYDRLAFDVFVPAGAPNDMRVMVYLRDGDLWWFETLLPTYLRPGDWTKLLVDLGGEVTHWEPRGHHKVFDRYALERVRVLGIRIFGHRPYHGPVYIDNLQLWREPRPRPRRAKVFDIKASAAAVPRFAPFELSFRLSRTFANPFDPGEADILAHFKAPGGGAIVVPAFFYQDYERHLLQGREVLTPTSRPCWKVRFTPAEVGTWTFSVTLNGKRLPALADQAFECVPSKLPGFVRRSQRDPRFFELSTGQFFYPIGMNLRSPSDNRKPYPYPFKLPEGKGTFIYDDYFTKLQQNGMNWARVWQCPWWCGLEWTKQWPGYQGLGRYNLENAWRFDYLLSQAERRGVYLQACLTNHGQITIERQIDRQWDSNPLNADLGEGGPLRRAADFYTDPVARKLFRQRLRYTVARWGYSTHLMTWALFSEMEFTEAYWRDAGGKDDFEGQVRCPVVAKWVGQTAAALKKLDPFDHLVTTHFSHPWRGEDIWSRPELDLVQSNAYTAFPHLGGQWDDRTSGDIARAVDRYYDRFMGRYDRPVLVAEWGGHWMGSPASRLDAELHSGLWATITSPLAGDTGFWWWLHVHFANRYAHYRAATRFMVGEDLRGLKRRDPQARGSVSLRARAMTNDTRAYVWVFHPRVTQSLEPPIAIKDARLELPDMEKGRYRVVFWDTYEAKPLGTRDLDHPGGTLTIPLPVFRNDLALKVKRK